MTDCDYPGCRFKAAVIQVWASVIDTGGAVYEARRCDIHKVRCQAGCCVMITEAA